MKILIEKKHSLMTRWNHWVNFPVLTIMVWSGFLIYWASPAYFIPGEWLDALGWNYKLATGMAWHFTFGIIFVINGLLYIGYLIYSKSWKYLIPDPKSWADALKVFLHDLRIYRGPLPETPKYNGAQKLTYTFILFLGLIGALTGFAIYKPVQLSSLASLFGGYTPARLIHFLVAWCFIAFFIVHIIQVTRAGWNHVRAMITGWEIKKDE